MATPTALRRLPNPDVGAAPRRNPHDDTLRSKPSERLALRDGAPTWAAGRALISGFPGNQARAQREEYEMGSLLLPALLALAAGASVVLQQMLTVLLRTALASTAWAGVVS